MTALISAVLFVGYTLTFAAVANGGVFATQPWMSLVDDPYSYKRKTGAGGTTGYVKDAEKAAEALDPLLLPGLSIGKKILGSLFG